MAPPPRHVLAVESSDLSNLNSVLGVLTALIAPALMITASASFVASTSSRLAMNITRTRDLADAARAIKSSDGSGRQAETARWLELELTVTYRRVHLEQEALGLAYGATIMFVACSLVLGMDAIAAFLPYWLPVALGLCGVVFLLIACALLMLEVRMMLRLMRQEVVMLRAGIEARLTGAPRRSVSSASSQSV